MFGTVHYIALVMIVLEIAAAISFRWPQGKGGPYWPSSMKKVRKILAMDEIKQGELADDHGCSDGWIIVAASQPLPQLPSVTRATSPCKSPSFFIFSDLLWNGVTMVLSRKAQGNSGPSCV